MIIAIDGPAAAGKGTLARNLAAALGFAYLDTGLIYRATAKKLIDQGREAGDETAAEEAAKSLGASDLSVAGLRSEEVGTAASQVSGIPAVRSALLQFQRDFAAAPPKPATGAVLDGRDIGTVVCPHADVKLYVTASDEVRATRRFQELQAAGEDVIYARVFEEMKARDARDQSRSIAPLKPAEDAVTLDTSAMTVDDVLAVALRIVETARG